MKYKVVGWLDLVLGGLALIQQLIMLFVVYPRLADLYSNFSADLPWYTKMFPYIVALGVLFLAVVVFTGWKLVAEKNPGKKMFMMGVGELILIILGIGYYLGDMMISVVGPIYHMTEVL